MILRNSIEPASLRYGSEDANHYDIRRCTKSIARQGEDANEIEEGSKEWYRREGFVGYPYLFIRQGSI